MSIILEMLHNPRWYLFCIVQDLSLRTSLPRRSLYALTRKEITRGIANRFVHSRTYIILYLTMAALSITTVALSLGSGCPPAAFYILEFVINSAMILEVTIRLVAFGKVIRNFFLRLANISNFLFFHSNFGNHHLTLLISFSPSFVP